MDWIQLTPQYNQSDDTKNIWGLKWFIEATKKIIKIEQINLKKGDE